MYPPGNTGIEKNLKRCKTVYIKCLLRKAQNFSEGGMAKILVIDDDEQCSQLLKQFYEQTGHAASIASDGNTGLKLARAEDFDLIITDVLMPEKDGFELIQELRRYKPEAKIIAISGGGVMHAEDCLNMARLFGAKYILRKPLNLQELLQITNELLQSSPSD
jgi:DNA-binding response OmpR family regulator